MEKLDFELKPNNAVRVRVSFVYVEAIKKTEQRFSELKYPMDMSVGEAVRNVDGSVSIDFSLRVATDPNIVAFEVRGKATITGPNEVVQELTVPEGNSPPPIWKKIYQETMTTIAFLARFFEIPPPPIITTNSQK